MKKIKFNLYLMVLAIMLCFGSCTSNSSNDKKATTNEEKSEGDAHCAYCGKLYVYKDGYLGKKEGMLGKASAAGRKGGAYCSDDCGEKSVYNK